MVESEDAGAAAAEEGPSGDVVTAAATSVRQMSMRVCFEGEMLGFPLGGGEDAILAVRAGTDVVRLGMVVSQGIVAVGSVWLMGERACVCSKVMEVKNWLEVGGGWRQRGLVMGTHIP